LPERKQNALDATNLEHLDWKDVETLRKELVYQLPKIVSNSILALIFWICAYIFSATGNSLNSQNLILFQIGLLFIAGVFLLRALLNALPILDKMNRLALKSLNLNKGLPSQRVLKDFIFIISIFLAMATFFPIFSQVLTIDSLLYQIAVYAFLGSILFFIIDIGLIFYRMSETKVNAVSAWISRINNRDKKIYENCRNEKTN
jgi:hypothetical protein